MTSSDKKHGEWPLLGCGVGLRSEHYPAILESFPPMDFFEAVSENYMNTGGRPLAMLEKVRERYPVVLHGVALSIGSCDPLHPQYLDSLKKLVDRIEPELVSDHLCWSGAGGETLHDLLPLPLTDESVQHVVRRVDQVQTHLGRKILLENVSTYVTFSHSVMPEWEFLVEVASRSGCGILLDINNLYVNAVNHGFNPLDYLRHIPAEKVGQFHLAGHTPMGKFLFDTHSARVTEAVWELYREALKLYGRVSTLIEWDEKIPSFDELSSEAARARGFYLQSMCRPVGNRHDCSLQSDVKSGVSLQKGQAVLAMEGFSLSQVQDLMKSAIQPLGANRLPDTLLNPQGGDPGKERMSVYADGYIARTHAALGETYPALARLIGPEDFCELAEAYAGKGPATEYDLAKIGEGMPDFLKTYPEISGKPYGVDLARFEWFVARAFHAYDGVPLQQAALQALAPEDWEHIRLIFQPSVYLFESDWPVLALWEARQQEKSLTGALEKLSEPERVLISRAQNRIRTEKLGLAQYRILRGLMAGRSLGAVCEDLADFEDEVSLQSWFSAWIQDGLLARLELAKSNQPLV